MVRGLLELGFARAIGILAASFVVAGLLAAGLLRLLEPAHPIRLHVRWTADVDDARRAGLEQQLSLREARHSEGTTFIYELDPTTEAIRAIVQHPSVEDTDHINRIRFRPEFEQDRERRSIFYGVLGGGVGAVAFLWWVVKRRVAQSSAAPV